MAADFLIVKLFLLTTEKVNIVFFFRENEGLFFSCFNLGNMFRKDKFSSFKAFSHQMPAVVHCRHLNAFLVFSMACRCQKSCSSAGFFQGIKICYYKFSYELMKSTYEHNSNPENRTKRQITVKLGICSVSMLRQAHLCSHLFLPCLFVA